MESKFLAVILILFLPALAFAQVKINEVNWMGVPGNAYAEWVELYNDGDAPVDLNGAALYEGGGSTKIIGLTKTIDSHGYYLIERVTSSSPDPVPGVDDDSGTFGGGGLSNSGEFLVIKDKNGVVLDQIDASKGWPAGDPKSYETMQWNGSGWITATATPRTANVSSLQTSGNISNSTSSDNLPSVDGSAISQDRSSQISSHSSGALLSESMPTPKFLISAGRDRLVATGSEIPFSANFKNDKGDDLDPANVSWSFGDGSRAVGKSVKHTYRFSGDYVVVLNATYNNEEFISRSTVKVVSPDVRMSWDQSEGDVLRISNLSQYELNVGNWSIEGAHSSFVFPIDTIILPGKNISLSNDLAGFSFLTSEDIKLKDSSSGVVFELSRETSTSSDITKIPQPVSPDVHTENVATSTMLSELQGIGEKLKLLSGTNSQNTDKLIVAAAPTKMAAVGQTSIRDLTKGSSTSEVIFGRPGSFLASLLSLPSGVIDYLRNLFF